MSERDPESARPTGDDRQDSPKAVVVAGVRYARRRERLAFFKRAGDWMYDVRFPDGEQMRIRPGASRRYQDLTHDALPDGFESIAESIRPGSRVFIAGAGTGLAGDIVARIVGTSGAVVTIECDGESVRYARKRYPRPNVSVEFASSGALAGEVEGSFNVTVALCTVGEAMGGDPMATKLDLLRVLGPGGRLIARIEELSEASGRRRVGRFAWVWVKQWERVPVGVGWSPGQRHRRPSRHRRRPPGSASRRPV